MFLYAAKCDRSDHRMNNKKKKVQIKTLIKKKHVNTTNHYVMPTIT